MRLQKMMPKELEAKCPKLYATEKQGDQAIVQVHYFCLMGGMKGWDWYLTEYDPETKNAFGFVKGDFPELGYFNIGEFEEINEEYGLNIFERDISWKPCKLETVKEER